MNERVIPPTLAAGVEEAARAAYSELSDLEQTMRQLTDLADTVFMLTERLSKDEEIQSPLLTLAQLIKEKIEHAEGQIDRAQDQVHPFAYPARPRSLD